MQQIEPLTYDSYYHIYNRGINRENLFETSDNYTRFLSLIEKYIVPIADVYAWSLMKNHFHLLIKIKEEKEIGRYKASLRKGTTFNFAEEKWKTASIEDNSSDNSDNTGNDNAIKIKKPNPLLHFSHVFNAYTKYYNLATGRTGSLFQRSFKRIEIQSEEYLRNLIVYIHLNPLIHGFVGSFTEYKWSSYTSILSDKPTNLKRDKVVELFGGTGDFEERHNLKEINHLEELEDE
jgi:REP element-mobilizing transposase RayT